MARNKRAAQHIDDLDEEHKDGVSRLLDVQQDGLDVVFEEDARDGVLADLGALLGDGVLVGEDGLGAAGAGAAERVDGRHNRHEVLEFVEVVVGAVDGLVEGVDEGGEEGPEGELGDNVGEVEGCTGCLLAVGLC